MTNRRIIAVALGIAVAGAIGLNRFHRQPEPTGVGSGRDTSLAVEISSEPRDATVPVGIGPTA